MVSRRIWYLAAVGCILLAGWHAMQPVEVIYSERELNDGTVFVSSVKCGNAPGMVFLGEYDPDVRGPATQNDCLRTGRTKVAEQIGLVVLAGVLVVGGRRFGKEPPRPIRAELPELPQGERGFHGRGRHRGRDDSGAPQS